MVSIKIFFSYGRIEIDDVKLYKSSFTLIFYPSKPFNGLIWIPPKIAMVSLFYIIDNILDNKLKYAY